MILPEMSQNHYHNSGLPVPKLGSRLPTNVLCILVHHRSYQVHYLGNVHHDIFTSRIVISTTSIKEMAFPRPHAPPHLIINNSKEMRSKQFQQAQLLVPPQSIDDLLVHYATIHYVTISFKLGIVSQTNKQMRQ